MLSPLADRQQFGIGVRWNAAHNSFIQAGAELGIPGLMIFVGLIAGTFLSLRRSSRATTLRAQHQRERALTHALTAALIAFVVGAFFLSLTYSEMLFTLVALAVGLEKVTSLT
jgi:O-antigen ligase